MFGFLIGTACLIGFVATLRGRRRGLFRGGACGGRWDDGGGYGRERGLRGGLLRALFERLDTSPGQEKVLRAAADELHAAGEKLRGEGRKTREDVAKVLRGPFVDEALFGEIFSRHDVAIEELRRAVVGALARAHEALDERQRARLADLVQDGPFGGGFGRRHRGGGDR
jgi:hypothetical protein